MSETQNRQTTDCDEQMADEPVIVEDVMSDDEEEASELLPREEDMEAAADIVIQADKAAAAPSGAAAEPGAVRVSGTSQVTGPVRTSSGDDPPSVIAVRDDTTEMYDTPAEELDSITQSIPLLVASLARENKTMTVEALEARFQQITEMLVSLQQRQYESQPASQPTSNSSLTTSGQYSEALEQRFQQITDMLNSMQQQQVETLRRFEEAQLMNQHRSGFNESMSPLAESERTTSVTSSDPTVSPPGSGVLSSLTSNEWNNVTVDCESSQELSGLSMKTCRPGAQNVSSRSSIDPSGSFSYLGKFLHRDEMRHDLPKPDPPAMQVLVEDVLEKLDPDGKILTDETDSDVPCERLTPVHSVRRGLVEESSESSLDRKLPARSIFQERWSSAQSHRTTDLREGNGDEAQSDRKLPPRNLSKKRQNSDGSQRTVDTGGGEYTNPSVREPDITGPLSYESPMHIIQCAALRIKEPTAKEQSIDQDAWGTRADTQVGGFPVKEINKLNVMAPPGHLGVTFADATKPPTVGAVKKSSPLASSLEVGDELLKVDDEDVKWMSSAMVRTLLACKEDEYRELSIQRAVRVGSENHPVSRQMFGRQAAASLESNAEISKSETPEDARVRCRAEVETLVRLLIPEEIDNVDVMMDWFSGHEADLVSTLRTIQRKSMAQRAQAEENESDSSSDEKREARIQSSETIGREPSGIAPAQPPRRRRPARSVVPGAFRVGGIEDDGTIGTIELGSSTASPEPISDTFQGTAISATLVSDSDHEAQLTQLNEAVATIQRQQEELLEANRNGGRFEANRNEGRVGSSRRNRLEALISRLFCLRRRPAYQEET